MRKDYFISLLIHLSVLAIIIIFSSTTTKAKPPSLLGDVVTVGFIDKMPVRMPEMAAPSDNFSDGGSEPEAPVKLASVDKKEKINKPKPEPKPKEPKKDPDKGKTKETKKTVEPTQSKTESTGSGVDIEVGSEGGSGTEIYDGPLGEYYLAYDFNYIKRRVSQNWDNPVKSNKPLACKVYFQITKDGQVQGVVLRESSGVSLFDKYAEFAVQAIKQLPALPHDFPDHEVLEVNFTFNYRP